MWHNFIAGSNWFLNVFGRPFVKQFAQCYQIIVVLSCLFVTLVYCGLMVGWIKMKLGVQVGLGSGHIVLDGSPAPTPPKGHSPQFLAHIYCGKMAGWIKMPLGRELGLSPNDIVLDGDPVPPPQKRGQSRHPILGPCLLWPNG